MKALENPAYLAGYILFNLLAIVFLFAAAKRPRTARLLFFLLFGWASIMNWKISQQNPLAYQEYADLTFIDFYQHFIRNWFRNNTRASVGVIATAQAMIAVSMLLRGMIFRVGAAGAVVFLLAIAPLGVGSGFPCTVIFAVAMILLYNKADHYWWHPKTNFKSPAS